MLAAIFAAYVVLGILYESFIHPITIISGLPSAGVGALLVLMVTGMDLSVIAMIGIVMLVGIVKKNAIMMIDFAIERRRVGLSAEAAIREACLLRFRPIMMTTFAAIFGTLPIALGTGAGAELRQPLGIAVVGGLCVSQLLTLYITPVVYLYLDRIDRVLQRRLEPQLEAVPSRRVRRCGRMGSSRRIPGRGAQRWRACRVRSDREAGAAAAGRGGLRVIDLERLRRSGRRQSRFRSRPCIERDRIDQHSRAVAREHEIVLGPARVDVELVLKSGTAAALDATRSMAPGGSRLEDFADPPCRALGQGHCFHGRVHMRHVCDSDRYAAAGRGQARGRMVNSRRPR